MNQILNMKQWRSDDELFALAREHLFTAVVGDILDNIGFQKQFLPPHIRALHPDMVLIGRAMTVLSSDIDKLPVDVAHSQDIEQPFGLMLEALDDLKTNEVYLSSGASPDYALWGELMSTRAMHCGAAGAVVNGFHRDTRGILKLNFPVFSFGAYAQDQAPRGKVIDFRCGINVSGVQIDDGDIVFGDIDGVLIIPRKVEREVFSNALEKALGEKTVRKAIQSGMTAVDAFKHYGIM